MKNIFKICIVGLLIFSLPKCTGILDQEPESITHADVFWTNQDNVEQATAGAYALLKNTLLFQANFLLWGEIPGMTFIDSRFWISNYIENNGNFVLPYRDDSRDWKDFYRVANWATTIEHYIEQMDVEVFESQTAKDNLEGEAAFLKALSYFYIAKIWGEAPIVHESVESSSQLLGDDGYITEIPKSSEIEVIDFALLNAEKAITLLEYSSPGEENWAIRANKASAETLKLHLLLWKTSRTGNSAQLNEAIATADNIINGSNAQLMNYVRDTTLAVEKMCIGQSETGLFEINISSDISESFRVQRSALSHTGLTLSAPILDRKTNFRPQFNPDFYSNQVFMTDDQRMTEDVRLKHFLHDYPKLDGFVMKYAYGTQDPDVENVYAQFSESNLLIFRLADVYLLRAEAHARLGDLQSAIADLNQIRAMAGVSPYAGSMDFESVWKAIFDERAIEFIGEGHAAFDRIRMNYWEGVPWMNTTRFTQRGFFWPIHPNIISKNPSISQIEYWRGKI